MGWFYRIGRSVGPKLRKGQWYWNSLTGSEADAIEAEQHVGRDLHEEVVLQAGRAGTPAEIKWVEETGQRLASCVRNKQRRFHWTILAGESPNAFALPGGFVYITPGLLELMGRDPDELAFVLGHEMGHVIKQHPMERIMNDTALSAVARAMPAAGGAAGRWLQGSAMQLLQCAYSQENELLADRFGIKLAAAAGYEPSAGARLFERLSDREGRPSQIVLAEYFSSHPPLDVRIAELRKFVPVYGRDAGRG